MAQPAYFSSILRWAALYNMVWGAWVVLFPNSLFDWAGLARPLYPGIWQCVGMIVGAYGLGYAIASTHPLRHWPIVLVGLIGKVLGPIGFIEAYVTGVFNLRFGITIIFNDIIWWVPFYQILNYKIKEVVNTMPKIIETDLKNLTLPNGQNVLKISNKEPLLFVLVRHRGCTFCRESLQELADNLESIRKFKFKPIVVHMGDTKSSQEMQAEYKLEGVVFIADPERRYYSAFKVRKGTFKELFGPRVWVRGFMAGVIKVHGVGSLEGDGFQLGGVYLVEKGQVQHLHNPCDAADVENWSQILADFAMQNG